LAAIYEKAEQKFDYKITNPVFMAFSAIKIQELVPRNRMKFYPFSTVIFSPNFFAKDI
jgi:hypothetical protein